MMFKNISKITISEVFDRMLTKCINAYTISPKYLYLTDVELNYHRSRILSKPDDQCDELKFLLNNSTRFLKYTDQEILDIFDRSRLYTYNNNRSITIKENATCMSIYLVYSFICTMMSAPFSMLLGGIPVSFLIGISLDPARVRKNVDDYSYAVSYVFKKKKRLRE